VVISATLLNDRFHQQRSVSRHSKCCCHRQKTANRRRSLPTKGPGLAGAFRVWLLTIQAFFLRLAKPMPTKPIPKRAKVPGSGTATNSITKLSMTARFSISSHIPGVCQ